MISTYVKLFESKNVDAACNTQNQQTSIAVVIRDEGSMLKCASMEASQTNFLHIQQTHQLFWLGFELACEKDFIDALNVVKTIEAKDRDLSQLSIYFLENEVDCN